MGHYFQDLHQRTDPGCSFRSPKLHWITKSVKLSYIGFPEKSQQFPWANRCFLKLQYASTTAETVAMTCTSCNPNFDSSIFIQSFNQRSLGKDFSNTQNFQFFQ